MKLGQVLRPIAALNRSRHLLNSIHVSMVKYKFTFFQALSLASPSSLLKVPNDTQSRLNKLNSNKFPDYGRL